MTIRDSVALWRILSSILALGMLSLLILHWTPPGEEELPPEARAYLGMAELMDQGSEEEALALAQHFGRASELPSAPETARVKALVRVMEMLNRDTREGFLDWVELIPYRIGEDDWHNVEVTDHNEVEPDMKSEDEDG